MRRRGRRRSSKKGGYPRSRRTRRGKGRRIPRYGVGRGGGHM